MRRIAIVLLAGSIGCTASIPDTVNTPIGLDVVASVTPTVVSVSDTAATITLRVTVDNNSADRIIIVTGGPPWVFTPDPVNSGGLGMSYRIGRAGNPLNAGPQSDSWGSPVDTFPAHVGYYVEDKVTLKAWRQGGWTTDTGTYTLHSYYNGHEGASATFRLVP